MSSNTPVYNKLKAWVNAQHEPFTREEMLLANGVSVNYSKKFISRCSGVGALRNYGGKRGRWVRVHSIPVPEFKSRPKPKLDLEYELQELNYAGPSIIDQALASRPLLVLVFDAAIRAQDGQQELIAA